MQDEILKIAKPILFNTEMVGAILDGRKTQTRRVVDYKKVEAVLSSPCRRDNPDIKDDRFINSLCVPRYEIGDVLYVRETWEYACMTGYLYKAGHEYADRLLWHPSIHMPKEAARIFLRVTGVRAERLQDILCSDMIAEGAVPITVKGGQWQQWQDEFFKPLWDSAIKKKDIDRHGWKANPWVWVYEFEREE